MEETLTDREKVARALHKASSRFHAARKELRGGRASSASLWAMAQAKRDIVDLKLCEDYLKRKEAGTLQTMPWKEAWKQLGFEI